MRRSKGFELPQTSKKRLNAKDVAVFGHLEVDGDANVPGILVVAGDLTVGRRLEAGVVICLGNVQVDGQVPRRSVHSPFVVPVISSVAAGSSCSMCQPPISTESLMTTLTCFSLSMTCSRSFGDAAFHSRCGMRKSVFQTLST